MTPCDEGGHVLAVVPALEHRPRRPPLGLGHARGADPVRAGPSRAFLVAAVDGVAHDLAVAGRRGLRLTDGRTLLDARVGVDDGPAAGAPDRQRHDQADGTGHHQDDADENQVDVGDNGIDGKSEHRADGDEKDAEARTHDCSSSIVPELMSGIVAEVYPWFPDFYLTLPGECRTLLVVEQPALGRQAVLISPRAARARDGAVARDERCEQVAAAGAAGRARRRRQSGLGRELAVGEGLAGRDALQRCPDCLLVRGSGLLDGDVVQRREVASSHRATACEIGAEVVVRPRTARRS